MSPLVRRALVSHALAAVGMSLPWPLLLLVVWERTGDGLLLGLAGAARMAPYVLFSWLAGRIADRTRRDALVRATLGARLGLLGLMALAWGMGWTAVAVLAAAAAVAVATPAYPALAAAVPGLAQGPDRGRATEWLVTIEVSSFVVGPAIGGLLLAPVLRPAVPVLAVACLAGAWVAWRGVRLPAPVGAVVDGPPVGSGGVTALLVRSAPVRTAVALVALVNAVLAVVGLALLPLTADWEAAGPAYGVAVGAFGFGALAAPLLSRLGRHDRARIRWGMVCFGGCVAVLALTGGLAHAVLPLALGGAVAVVVESAATGLIQEQVPDRMRASVLGLTDTAMVAAAMVGALAAPVLAEWVGPRALLLALAGLCVLSLPAARGGLRTLVVPASRASGDGALPAQV